ncbi:MSHA biogenesis protein MshK [Noviherbaspirillum sp. UKPF54]|uniref:MSHA biogenesis protein MshK n=1 Tax=Noviherbaspirillum sp. UKPF54 TaxID=2601898 RepID=UPI001AF00606|nr:MSHA biogenesis protein MshK [Noviherbaspirillum sp. UKPF54]
MAEHLTAIRICAIGSLLCTAAAALPAHAQELSDPTRPATAVDVAPGAQAAAPVLQSILISGTRREAIIGAQLVRVGDRYGDAQIAQILEDRVVLRNEKGMQTLRLFPGIEKRAVAVRGGFDAAVRHNNIEKHKE